MPRFAYRATDAEGNEISGELMAPQSEAAVATLGRLGYQVSWLEATERAPGAPARGLPAAEQLSFFNRQLAAMTKTGIPVSQAVGALAQDMRRGRLRNALAAVARDLESGKSPAEAFEAQRQLFPPAYVHLMEAGTRSGNLPAVFLMLSTYSRTIADLRRAVISALWYPLIVVVFCITLFTFISLAVAPQVAVMYKEFNPMSTEFGDTFKLPWMTRMMMFLTAHVWWVLGVLAAVIVIVWLWVWWMRHTAAGRRRLDGFKLRVPIVRRMLRASLLSRLSRTLGLLLKAGVPMLEALRLSREALGNATIEARLAEIEKRVADGQPLGQALQSWLRGGEVFAWAVHLGEQRGDLVQTLDDTADIYDIEARHHVQVLKTAMLPILVVIVAVTVILTALSLLGPLFGLLKALTGGMGMGE